MWIFFFKFMAVCFAWLYFFSADHLYWCPASASKLESIHRVSLPDPTFFFSSCKVISSFSTFHLLWHKNSPAARGWSGSRTDDWLMGGWNFKLTESINNSYCEKRKKLWESKKHLCPSELFSSWENSIVKNQHQRSCMSMRTSKWIE